ncbi:epidermal growth factor receptor kinase substrate 8-like protein 3b [Chaetodon trifascialis]|uniref:epidermal growth factor receptor kinase substrate 8-like protein 3b n=1 Tax=Chaetodon trifascialis TaxID=109706 RepID=UPI0039932B61
MFGRTGPFSYSPRGFTQEDFPQLRQSVREDDLNGAPLHRNNMSRPNAKSIYMQRKEYSETLNKQSDNFHVRVEHLFTCELDGQELKTVDDCLAKLKRLDAKGRLWPQEMIMEVQRGYLLLSDIETKAELESVPLDSILQTKAVLDSCAYNSLLTIAVQDRYKRVSQLFMFQCEETGAEHIKSDLDKALKKRDDLMEPRRDQSDIRINLENIIGQHPMGRAPSPLDIPPPQWREPEEFPRVHTPDLHELQSSPEVVLMSEQRNTERNTDIFNHVLNDLEVFLGKISAALSTPQGNKNNKKKKKKKSKEQAAPAVNLPPLMEYLSFLQKVKYGFNLLGKLEGSLSNPTAADFVHIIFTILEPILPLYPADVPPTVVSPLLTVPALRLLTQAVNAKEENLWISLGDSWNLPRSKWPNDVAPYIPEFYDGWQPPAPSRVSSPLSYVSSQASRNSTQRFPSGQHQLREPVNNHGWSIPSPTHLNEPPLYMRVTSDFMGRNNRELSVMRGETVQVIQQSKQWWLVRNSRNEEGNVPLNVLEPMTNSRPREAQPWGSNSPVTLDMSSTPAEVKAWLEYKGFSRLTVNSLRVLSGKLLLGMTKDELRTVCPEEGGKVFFQLQSIKSAIALASEPSRMYNGRY